jgi:hypothetical protein
MQENCLFGSEGGAKLSFVPTPIRLAIQPRAKKHPPDYFVKIRKY